MNIDDTLPKSTPDVNVEAAAAFVENALIETVKPATRPIDSLSPCSFDRIAEVPDVHEFGRSKTTTAVQKGPGCEPDGDAKGDTSAYQSATTISLSPPAESISRCQPNPQSTPHLPREDVDYQQCIYGTGHLQHLLRQPLADSQSDRDSSCSPTAQPIVTQSSPSAIGKMFGAKRTIHGSIPKRSAYRSRMLDRSAAGTGGLGDSFHTARRVSFPENDAELVTGYLEPANPWATVKPITTVNELSELYRESCAKHRSRPIEAILQHLASLGDLSTTGRRPLLNLREQSLSAASCEALEEVLKRLQYKLIDLTSCDLDDVSATALFEMVEYYEAANEIDISENRNITTRGWNSCINMIKRSQALEMLSTRKTPLSDINAQNLGKALNASSLHTLKLESCGLSGRPMNSLCNYLRKNNVLKELYLSDNDLTSNDALNVAMVLKSNFHLNFLDVSNNKIEDIGLRHIVEALLEQAHYFRRIQDEAIAAAAAAVAASIVSLATPETPITDLVLSTPSQSSLLSSSTDDDDVITDLPQIESSAPKRSTLESLLQTQKLHEDAAQKKDKLVDAATITDPGTNHFRVDNNVNNNNALPVATKTEEEVSPAQPKQAYKQSTSFDLNENKPNQTDRVLPAGELDTPHAPLDNSSGDALQRDLILFEESDRVDGRGGKENEKTTGDGGDDNKPNDLVKQVQIECSNNRINNQSEADLSPKLIDPVMPPSPTLPLMRPPTPAAIATRPHVIDEIQLKEATICTIEDVVTELVEFTLTPPLPPPIIPFILTLPPATTTTAASEIPALTSENLKSHTSSNSHPTHSKSLESSLSEENAPNYRSQNSSTPERSFSLESLNSETSVDSNDSKSSIKLAEQKFNKNGTLERQQQTSTCVPSAAAPTPTGLQMLILWNNGVTRESSKALSDLFAATTTLELLNIGRNVLSNDFLSNVKTSLKTNTSLTDLGLQSTHLTCSGIKTLSECLEFGGNSTLQRIDVRDNHLQVAGLNSLNDALKSNKTVTRVELDEIPRRAHDLSADSTIDYSRMVTHIRTQCARNENPPKPEPVRTSAINKRVRATHLSSRKISLTCDIRSFEPPTTTNAGTSTTAATSIQPKGDRLLNPERKHSGRLRSPLPSPSPSPTPSPSRNRFHVSRVLESSCTTGARSSLPPSTQSATTSPMTPPSSSSCSPTSFFPATHHPHHSLVQHQPQHSSSVPKISRFRVTTVAESKLPKHKSLPDHLNQSNNSTILLPTTSHPLLATTPSRTTTNTTTTTTSTKADTTTKDHEQHLAISPNNTKPTTSLTDPTTTTSGTQHLHDSPTKTDFSPIESIQSSNRHHLPYSKSQPELTTNTTTESAHLQPSSISPTAVINVTTAAAIISDCRKPDMGGSTSLITTTSTHKLSTSLDSPDMEVKRYMDDSCSSISSMDSIDRHVDFRNTSLSSMDSIDYNGTPPSLHRPKLLQSINSPTTHPQIPIYIDQSQCEPHSLTGSTMCTSKTTHDSLSSLETSTGSSDSLFDDSTQPGPPPPSSSSNEGTLTNSPIGVSSGCTSPSPSSEGERDVSVGLSPVKSERKRKTSWINPDSGYSASIDKLLSIFQNPGTFFTRQSTNTPTSGMTDDKKEHPEKQPTRKDSPMSGLFGWSTMSTRKDPDLCPDVPSVSSSPPQAMLIPAPPSQLPTKSIKAPLQPNWSPENTITATTQCLTTPASTSTGIPPDTQFNPATSPSSIYASNIIVAIPDRLQKEMKENISPEHTITSATLISVKSQLTSHNPAPQTNTAPVAANLISSSEVAVAPDVERVHFELGGDDDEEDEDENNDYTMNDGRPQNSSIPPRTSQDLGRGPMMHGLGQITRDSLSILHGGASSTNSRDSMRSLESLSENDNV